MTGLDNCSISILSSFPNMVPPPIPGSLAVLLLKKLFLHLHNFAKDNKN